MDDLLSEDWQKPAKATPTLPSTAPIAFASTYSSLRASPALPQSGTLSPANLSRPSSTVNGASAKAPTSDSFGNLLALKTQKGGSGVSMQERQRQLLEERKRQQDQQSQLWDTLGSGKSTPEIRQPTPAPPAESESDILAAFNKDAPVNRASFFSPPPPSGEVSRRNTPVAHPVPSANAELGEDDDPFGLSAFSKRSNGHVAPRTPAPLAVDDDDILGDLGRPVSERPVTLATDSMQEPMLDRDVPSPSSSERDPNQTTEDRTLAELIDMGFPPDTARLALAENGGDLQSAVGWLLQQAHEESRQKARNQTPNARSRSPPLRRRPQAEQDAMPPWLRQEERSNGSGERHEDASQTNGERNPAQASQEFGSKFLKSANAFWKAGQKQVAKTLSEFQQDGDASQPKWMRGGGVEDAPGASQRRQSERQAPARAAPDLTDEAALLDAPRQKPPKSLPPVHAMQTTQPSPARRDPGEPLQQRPSPQFPTRPEQRDPALLDKRPATKLSRQDIDDQTAQAYISPARRKRPTPKPEPKVEPEVDLFSPAPVVASPAPRPLSSNTLPSRAVQQPSVPRAAPTSTRPKAPPRNIPAISPSALSTSAAHRKAGGQHFKRGDYGAAHESYTSALTPIPPSHPIAIIILSNRSLTALKTGDAKVAVSDADRALEIIGPGLGTGETIDLGAGEGMKDMKEFYGKALMRKAEAQEHMERYSDAAATWRLAIEAGVGGSVSLRGRDRCEKAATPKPPTSTAAVAKPIRNATPGPGRGPPPKSLGNSLNRPTITSASSHEAVKKLRAANAEAEKADDEKFALADIVDAKLTAWRGGKTENLRALLQSVDAVLWEAAGWKKVGMSDLIMPNKVKIVYMKAIGKVHPDKIPQDATTEQRMISAAVFATLNEAWDKFKTENNL